jgi:hypothetical protein
MFMKTGRKFLAPDLFSPGLKPRLLHMSIMSALFPFLVSVSAHALAAPTPVIANPTPVALPSAAEAPAPAIVPVVFEAPAPAPVIIKPAAPKPPAVKPQPLTSQPSVEAIKVQAPAALDRNAIIDRVAKALTDTKTAQGRFTQVDPPGLALLRPVLHRPPGQGALRIQLARAHVHRLRRRHGLDRGAQAQRV